jgi:HPt (histidine-containing phosphotransfer) domain-containing protein
MAELAEAGAAPEIREVLEMFLDDMPRHLSELAAAIEAGDAAAVRRLGHGLKGGCAQVGAPRLAHIAAEWEFDRRDPDHWRALRRMFDQEFARVKAAMLAHPILQRE